MNTTTTTKPGHQVIDPALAERLKALRHARGLSVTEMAQAVGLWGENGGDNLRQMERGVRALPGTLQVLLPLLESLNSQIKADTKITRVASTETTQAINDALGLQTVSIQLPKSVIQDFKSIAEIEGVGHQPLMRKALISYAECEAKRVVREYAAQRKTDKERRHSSTHAPL